MGMFCVVISGSDKSLTQGIKEDYVLFLVICFEGIYMAEMVFPVPSSVTMLEA